jgi:hypothetical protein
MARPKIKLDHAGIAAGLKSGWFESEVNAAAEAAADAIRGMGIQVEGSPGTVDLPVEVRTTITDRAHASVTIAHASGEAVQAKRGALTKGAAAAGLEVRSK